jgi:uncharacterized iron-regulated protein
MRRLLATIFVVGACGGGTRYPEAKKPAGDDSAPRGVAAAELPYSIVDGRTGSAVSTADFWAALGGARVVCVGEDHPNPHHHWAQLEIVQHLDGAALGMEMVQRPFQAVLDDYAAGRIDAASLQSRVGWHDRWGYEWSLYEPVIAAAVGHGGALLALNAAKELTKKVAREGLDALTTEERAGIAKELVLDDAEHRAWFEEIMGAIGDEHHGGHGHGHGSGHGGGDGEAPSMDRVYTAQVIWDETMAETAATWVDANGRPMVIIAGAGHCHDSAIVRRVARRGVTPVLSVRPIIDDGQGNVSDAILEKRNDYLFVMTMP